MSAVINANQETLNTIIALYKEVYGEENYQQALQKALKTKNKEGFTVLMQAVKNKNSETLNTIIDLYKEAYRGATEEYQQALQEALKTPNSAGFTVLMSAVKNGNPDTVNAVADLHNSVGLPLNFLNERGMSIIKSVIIDSETDGKTKIEHLNTLIQKDLELNPKETWKYAKEDNSLLFATYCCSLIHQQKKNQQKKKKLKQLIKRLNELKTKRQGRSGVIIDNIAKSLGLKRQENYIALLDSFNKTARELEVSDLQMLMEGSIVKAEVRPTSQYRGGRGGINPFVYRPN